MVNLFRKFFYVPQYGKIDDKVMVTRVITSVVTVILCLAAMGFSAYAYFSHDLTSATNTLKGAKFDAKVQMQLNDANGETVTVVTSNYKTHIAELKAGQTYFITAQHTSASTAKTGFLIVTAENCNTRYHTVQLGKDGAGLTETITFCLTPTADTKVTFLAHWGTSSYYGYATDNENYIQSGESVTMHIGTSVTQASEGADATTPDPTDMTEPTETEGTSATEETTDTTATEADA